MGAFSGTACDALAAISKNCAQYALGLSPSIDIAEAADIESIPAATGHAIATDIVMDSAKIFFRWALGDTDLEFASQSVGVVGSQSYQNTLTVFIPVARAAVETVINAMLNGEFVIRFADKQGLSRLLGDDNSPAYIPVGGVQEAVNNERNGVTITFQNMGHTPYFYSGAIALV